VDSLPIATRINGASPISSSREIRGDVTINRDREARGLTQRAIDQGEGRPGNAARIWAANGIESVDPDAVLAELGGQRLDLVGKVRPDVQDDPRDTDVRSDPW
jgi:hypothetical protein